MCPAAPEAHHRGHLRLPCKYVSDKAAAGCADGKVAHHSKSRAGHLEGARYAQNLCFLSSSKDGNSSLAEPGGAPHFRDPAGHQALASAAMHPEA